MPSPQPHINKSIKKDIFSNNHFDQSTGFVASGPTTLRTADLYIPLNQYNSFVITSDPNFLGQFVFDFYLSGPGIASDVVHPNKILSELSNAHKTVKAAALSVGAKNSKPVGLTMKSKSDKVHTFKAGKRTLTIDRNGMSISAGTPAAPAAPVAPVAPGVPDAAPVAPDAAAPVVPDAVAPVAPDAAAPVVPDAVAPVAPDSAPVAPAAHVANPQGVTPQWSWGDNADYLIIPELGYVFVVLYDGEPVLYVQAGNYYWEGGSSGASGEAWYDEYGAVGVPQLNFPNIYGTGQISIKPNNMFTFSFLNINGPGLYGQGYLEDLSYPVISTPKKFDGFFSVLGQDNTDVFLLDGNVDRRTFVLQNDDLASEYTLDGTSYTLRSTFPYIGYDPVYAIMTKCSTNWAECDFNRGVDVGEALYTYLLGSGSPVVPWLDPFFWGFFGFDVDNSILTTRNTYTYGLAKFRGGVNVKYEPLEVNSSIILDSGNNKPVTLTNSNPNNGTLNVNKSLEAEQFLTVGYDVSVPNGSLSVRGKNVVVYEYLTGDPVTIPAGFTKVYQLFGDTDKTGGYLLNPDYYYD